MVSTADIPPGGEGKVEVKVHTAGRSGKLSKTVTVETDDPAEPRVTLTVNANVVVDLDLEVPTVVLPVKVGEEQVRLVKVLAKDPARVQLGEVHSDLKEVTARLVRETENGVPVHKLEVKAKPRTIGQLAGRVTVKVLQPRQVELALAVNVQATGDISIQPTRLTLMAPQTGGPVTGTITLKADKGTFKILKAEDPNKQVVLKQETVTAGKEYRIQVTRTAKEGENPPPVNTQLVITTNAAQAPKVEIPVQVRPAPSAAPGNRPLMPLQRGDIKSQLLKQVPMRVPRPPQEQQPLQSTP